MIGTLYIDGSDSCTDFESTIPNCIYSELEIVDSSTVEGLDRSAKDNVFRFPLLDIDGERATSKKHITNILQTIAVQRGFDPPDFE